MKAGWLGRQFNRNSIEVACWPESMRREGGFTDDDLTVSQKKQAAAILRKRADELDPPSKPS